MIINQMREKFWIQGLQNTVKKDLNKLSLRKNRRASPPAPRMGMLPDAQHFGPLLVRVGLLPELYI